MSGASGPVRTAVVWCPDWPVTAAGYGPDVPAAVLSANRVVACSAAARAEGVRRGHRRREAQARCPELVVLGHEPDRDAREFEPVVTVVEALAPGVAIVHPGILALRARGPARYFGGDAQVAELLAAEAGARLLGIGAPAVGVGIADGLFAALLAARSSAVVPTGESATFLAPQDISTLQLTGAAGAGAPRDALVDLLRRLGLRTLGAFAGLPTGDVASRFDAGGALAHRLARGLDPAPVSGRTVPVDLEVTLELDPPADKVEAAAFAARMLAERLQDRLAGHGLACTRLVVTARTEAGEEHARTWRNDGALTAAAIVDRTRWQLDGWLSRARREPADRGGVAAAAGRRGSRGARGLPAHAVGWLGETSTRGRTVPWPGCRACSGRRRCWSRCSAADAARASRSGWCRGRTSGSPPTRTTGPGPAGSRPRTRPPSCTPPSRSRCATSAVGP